MEGIIDRCPRHSLAPAQAACPMDGHMPAGRTSRDALRARLSGKLLGLGAVRYPMLVLEDKIAHTGLGTLRGFYSQSTPSGRACP